MLLFVLLAAAVPVQAQQPQFVELIRTADGHALDYPANGVWRVRADRVRQARAALLTDGAVAALNATSGTTALAGTLRFPSLLLSFSNNDTTTLPRTARYDSLYYGTVPLAGRTYSLRTFYQELSNGLLNIEGVVAPWSSFDSTSAWLFQSCPGLQATDCATGRQRLRTVFVHALTALDATVDFGQFDNDGPDGIPNSGDDDGVADVVQFVQPQLGAECGGPAIGAHKWFMSSLGGAYTTSDARTGGGFITVNAYHIVSGVGGASAADHRGGCSNSTAISGIGTSAHELGHGLGLPDLYDVFAGVGGPSGIGEWGLMGSGNYTSANSPTHMEAWSRADLGWVTVVPLASAGSYQLSPVESADTVYLVRPSVTNSRGEYFLLENRQAVGSDTANMLVGGLAGPKGGGLIIWHVDSTKMATTRSANTVNNGIPAGLRVVQADGLGQLQLATSSGGNRGDAGDPWPGSSNRTTFGVSSTPFPQMNANGGFAGFTVDSIRQLTPGGAMAFRVGFGVPITITINGNGTASGPGLTIPGTTFVSDTAVVTAVPNTGFIFDGWSGDTTSVNTVLRLPPTRSWIVAANYAAVLSLTPATSLEAVMGAPFQTVLGAIGGTGTYSWTKTSGDLPPGLALGTNGTISGTATATGAFEATVQVRSGSQTLSRTVSITVSAPALAVSVVVQRLLGGDTGALTGAELTYLDLLGNKNGQFDIGDFLAWVDATGATPSAAQMQAVMRASGGNR